jgi:hypothetical protein
MEIARRKNKSFAQYTGVDAPADPTGWGGNKKIGLKSTPADAPKQWINIHSLIQPGFAVSFGQISGLETAHRKQASARKRCFESISTAA